MRLLLLSIFLSFYTVMFAQVTNDECSQALSLPAQMDYCSSVGAFSNEGATTSFPDYPACIDEEDRYKDIWIRFTALATDASISVIGNVPRQVSGTLQTPQLLIYQGDCDNLVEQGCLSPFNGTHQVSGIFTDLMPGQTYYLNIGGRFGREGSFQVCVNQFNSVPEPSGDCSTGVVLCDKSSFAVNFLSGTGSVNDDLGDLLCNEAACGSASSGQVEESNSAWYKWTCDEAGTLTFDIDPLGGPNDDIDFLVYEFVGGLDDCDNKRNIRCMLSGESQGNSDQQNEPCLNNTGLSLSDSDDREECGCQPGNNNFAQAIEMVAGRSYALLIMNFSNSGNGFEISFGGTGTFVGPEAGFTTNTNQACVGETVIFNDSSTSLDPIDGYVWDFGPNAIPATATGQGPHNVIFNRPGNQTVLLSIETNRGCLVSEIQTDLEVVCCDDHFDTAADISPSICPGDMMGNINLTVNSDFAPQNYSWSNGETSEDINNLDAGLYTVTISDASGCETTRSFTVDGPPPFTFDTLITMPTCDGGQDGALTLVVDGGTPPYEFNFNNMGFGASNTISNLPVSTVNVIVRDANGCINEQNIFVNELVLELDPAIAAVQEPRCNGESNGRIVVNIDNGQGPYSYNFNQGLGFEEASILDNIPAGNYVVDVRDNNGCLGNFNFEVPEPPVLDIVLDARDISCFGQRDGEIVAAASGGRPNYTYQWSPALPATSTVNRLTEGSYMLTVTDDNGCPSVASATIIEPREIVGGVVEVIDNVCFGESNGAIRLTASGGTPGFTYSVQGQSFQIDSLLTGLAAGDFNLVIMDTEGCTDTVQAVVNQPMEFIVYAGDDLLVNLGFDTTINASSNYSPVTYSWQPEVVNCLNLDCSRVLVQPFNSTNYVVTGTNEAGCTTTAAVKVIVTNSKPVYIPNVFSPNGDGVNDAFTLFSGPAVMLIEQLQIFDRWGGLLFESSEGFPPNEPSAGWDGKSNGRPVNAGVFVYQFRVRFVNGNVGTYAGDISVIR